MLRAAAVVGVAVPLVLVAPGQAFADGGGADGGGANNIVTVVNHDNGSTRIEGHAAVAVDEGPSVANRNIAQARASCVGCRTEAAAIQVVVVVGSPDRVAPQNEALALNQGCQSCQTFAYARQVLVYASHRVDLGQTERQVHQVDAQVAQELASGQAFGQMASGLDSLAAQLVADVQQAIQEGGPPGQQAEQRQADQRQVAEHG